jgi:glucosamine--fructose-6-phosphate aminotransferase (isomerizing)
MIEGEYLADVLHQPQALEDTVAALGPSRPLDDIGQSLRRNKFQRIVLTGMGSSFHALHPLNLNLISEGFTSVMVETSELVHYKRRFFDPETLIVAVSQSGQSAEMIRLIEVNRRHSTVIAVTNTPESPLAETADASIVTRAGKEFSVSCKTYVAALAALHWLGRALCGRDLARTRADLKHAAPAVASYLADWKTYVWDLASRLQNARHLFMVGRGSSLSAVGTGALIVKESDRFHAEGMSSAAFRHGPLEMVGPDTFVVVFAGDKLTRELNQRLLEDILEKGGAADIVGESSSYPPFQIPDKGGGVRTILEILPIQMITLAIAARLGREPGRFELATKVTTTE